MQENGNVSFENKHAVKIEGLDSHNEAGSLQDDEIGRKKMSHRDTETVADGSVRAGNSVGCLRWSFSRRIQSR